MKFSTGVRTKTNEQKITFIKNVRPELKDVDLTVYDWQSLDCIYVDTRNNYK